MKNKKRCVSKGVKLNNKGSRTLPIPADGALKKVSPILAEDVYRYLMPVDTWGDPTIRKPCLEEIGKFIGGEFGNRLLLNTRMTGFIPEDAERVIHDLYLAPADPCVPDKNPDLYLARQPEGIPMRFFLCYVKSGRFVTHENMGAMRARLRINSAKELDTVYMAVVRFLQKEVDLEHREREREPGVPSPASREFYNHIDIYGNVTVNYGG